jgi:hypothetical protein
MHRRLARRLFVALFIGVCRVEHDFAGEGRSQLTREIGHGPEWNRQHHHFAERRLMLFWPICLPVGSPIRLSIRSAGSDFR